MTGGVEKFRIKISCYTKGVKGLSDTHPQMEELQIRLLREIPPWRKMQMLTELNRTVRLLALTGLRNRFPKASDEELLRRLADLLLGEDLARKVYGERHATS